MRTYTRLMAALILALALAQGKAVSAAEVIVVGAAIAKSGWMTPYDFPPFKAAAMAVEQINKSGGLLGKQIKLISGDTKTDRPQASKVAYELLDDGAEMLIVSCDYDEGAPAAIAAIDKGKLAFSLCAGDPKMGPQGLGPMAFTGSTGAGNQAYAMAEWAYYEKGLRTTYTLLDTSLEFHKGACSYFQMAWEQLPGAKLLGEDLFHNDDPSIASQITRIKALPTQPDFLWICGHTPGTPAALRQIRSAGIDIPILTVDSLDGDYWIGAVPNLSDFYYMGYCSIFGDDPRPPVRNWLKDYAAKYGGRPDTCFALPGYSVVEAWARAVERAGTTETAAVVKELEKFTDEPLLAGISSFSEEIHIQLNRPIVVMQVQNGKFSAIGMYRNKMIPPPQYRR